MVPFTRAMAFFVQAVFQARQDRSEFGTGRRQDLKPSVSFSFNFAPVFDQRIGHALGVGPLWVVMRTSCRIHTYIGQRPRAVNLRPEKRRCLACAGAPLESRGHVSAAAASVHPPNRDLTSQFFKHIQREVACQVALGAPGVATDAIELHPVLDFACPSD
jgi:hypothetical protein